MSRVCELTGKGRLKANIVSHSNIKTRRFRFSNIIKKKWFIPEVNRSMSLTLSTSALKVIEARGGIVPAILKEKDENLSDRLQRIKLDILKFRRKISTNNKSESQKREVPSAS